MGVQTRTDFTSRKFFLGRPGGGISNVSDIIAQNAGRVAVLASYTLMAKVAATGKWTPFINELAVDGTAIPQGIYTGDDIAAATLVAGDVTPSIILVQDMEFDVDMLVIENSKTLDTVIATSNAAAVYSKRTVRDYLQDRGLMPRTTNASTAVENT